MVAAITPRDAHGAERDSLRPAARARRDRKRRAREPRKMTVAQGMTERRHAVQPTLERREFFRNSEGSEARQEAPAGSARVRTLCPWCELKTGTLGAYPPSGAPPKRQRAVPASGRTVAAWEGKLIKARYLCLDAPSEAPAGSARRQTYGRRAGKLYGFGAFAAGLFANTTDALPVYPAARLLFPLCS